MLINAVIFSTLIICIGALLFLSLSLWRYLRVVRGPHRRYHEMFQRSADGVIVIRVNRAKRFFIDEMNGAAAAISPFSRPGQELAILADQVSGDEKRFLTELLDALHRVTVLERKSDFENSFWHKTERRLVTYQIHLVPMAEDGRVSHILGFMRDISAHKQTEILLTSYSRGFRALIEQSPDTIARYDLECHRIYANPAFKHLVITTTRNDSRWVTNEYCGTGYRRKIADVLSSGLEENIECTWTSMAGKSITSTVRLVPERDAAGQVVGVLSIGRDITELKETEHHLRESRAQLRGLTIRRELTAERIHNDIARAIHEEHGQTLSAIRIKLALLQMRFGQPEPELGQKIGELMGLLDHTIAQMRKMASAIHPAVLNMGISAALEWLADDLLAATDTHYEVHLAPSADEIDQAATALVFKIVQLALSNVLHHAAAQNVVISLDRQDSYYQLEVRDDGKGFDLDQSRKYSLGLVEMEELSHMLNGEIVFLSQPGKGTVVEVRFGVAAPVQPSLFEAA